jgi:predicted HTH domain antitoxin
MDITFDGDAFMAVKIPSLPDEWLIQELPALWRERPDLIHPLLHRLLSESKELSWYLVIRAYHERRVNLGKAAELLGLHELELRERFLELGIPLRLGPADPAEARAEVEAVRTWYSPVTSLQELL